MSQIQQEQIDAYLRNELSRSDLVVFEQKMASDPAFKEDVLFEEQVRNGISKFRKAELKARMDAIEIAPVWMAGTGSNAVIKTIGGFAIAGILGTGAYFLLNPTDVPLHRSEKTEYITENNSPRIQSVPEITVPVDESGSKSKPDPVLRLLSEEDKPAISDVDPNEGPMAAISTKEFTPQVSVPDFDEVETEEALKLAEVDIPEASNGDEVSMGSEPVDVKTVQRKGRTISYKYFDGKLFLYGDFKDTPYEILEINGTSGRRLYLYFDAQYYRVHLSDKVEELPQITEANLISELEILRNNKLKE